MHHISGIVAFLAVLYFFAVIFACIWIALVRYDEEIPLSRKMLLLAPALAIIPQRVMKSQSVPLIMSTDWHRWVGFGIGVAELYAWGRIMEYFDNWYINCAISLLIIGAHIFLLYELDIHDIKNQLLS
jgi:hypothetical protein